MTTRTKYFTKELLSEAIATGRNTVFSFPAGTGKTTAIKEYITDLVKNNDVSRKILYIAPTKSILDDMYNKLLDAGLPSRLVFNYHSSSPDYRSCLFMNRLNPSALKHRLLSSTVILITHERMKFDVVEKFLCEADIDNIFLKPLVFLDESIEDCNIAMMTPMNLDSLLVMSGLIDISETHHDYLKRDRNIYFDAKKLIEYFLTPREFCKNANAHKIAHLEMYNIFLTNNIGFGLKTDMNDPSVEARFTAFYVALARTIVQGKWIEGDNKIYINLPIAIQETWKKYAQIIVTDATAFLEPCFYQDFVMISSDDWNAPLLKNHASVANCNTRTQLTDNPQLAIDFLEKIDLNQYNKIYISTFKGKIQNKIYKYLSDKYSNFTIESNDADSVEEFLKTDSDRTTDELYTDSTKIDKVIYLTNFGRTRGSNKFRDCDCVIQIGNYRINPNFLENLSLIYTGLTSDQMSLANFIQELYRGRIRSNIEMESYCLVESNFFYFMEKTLKSLGFLYENMDDIVKNPNAKYGKNQKLVQLLFYAYQNKKILYQHDFYDVTYLNRWDKVRSRLLTVYKKYPELRATVFSKYPTYDLFKNAITLPQKRTKNIFSLSLFSPPK